VIPLTKKESPSPRRECINQLFNVNFIYVLVAISSAIQKKKKHKVLLEPHYWFHVEG
jgi:hypothetical protein